MGTFVTIHLVEDGPDCDEALGRAFGWFRDIEQRCTRFDPDSELMRLSAKIGVATPVSPMLFEAVRFALAVAEESGGAFDPTIGAHMEALGFDREHRTGAVVRTPIAADRSATYRDVHLDADRLEITIGRPLVLDLGAVAKGLAIDLAARELQPHRNFAIDAGGDLYLGGRKADGTPWSVGIRHPRREGEVIESLEVSDTAVCTSGDYERRTPGDAQGHHLLDPRTGEGAAGVASATAVASTALMADALATAAFVLGPVEGIQLFERMGIDGLIFSTSLERYATSALIE
jgi:thiamine biosynthesis lipoprotein